MYGIGDLGSEDETPWLDWLAHTDLVRLSLAEVWSKTRGGIPVFRYNGILFLTEARDYPEVGMDFWGGESVSEVNERYRADNERRVNAYGHLFRGKRWLDFGWGTGGFLSMVPGGVGLEPQATPREALLEMGHRVVDRIQLVAPGIEVVAMWHVLEHLRDPLGELLWLHNITAEDATVVAEVPHARCRLLNTVEDPSPLLHDDHLIMHTEESLRSLFEDAGWVPQTVHRVQRYGLANHLSWLCRDRPSTVTVDERLDYTYQQGLRNSGEYDTLVIIAAKDGG